MYGYFACIYVYVTHEYSAPRGQGVTDPLEVDLHVVVNHSVGGRNGTRFSGRAGSALNTS